VKATITITSKTESDAEEVAMALINNATENKLSIAVEKCKRTPFAYVKRVRIIK
jgi:hypothetical protein